MTTVQTATGAVDDADLGFTLSHEHILVGSAGVRQAYPFLFNMEATRRETVRELQEAREGGVGTIIDLTTMDLGRDVHFVADVSQASGVRIIVATGLWRDIPRFFWQANPDYIAEVFIREIEEGIEDSGIRAGVIKLANDVEGVTEVAERVLRAAARACRRTGAPISTHQWAPERVGARQVEIFADEGVDMSRVCIGHSADTTDVDYLEELLRAGVFLSMDRYPERPNLPDWRARNQTVKALIDRGWGQRLMLGHDYAPAPVLRDRPQPPRQLPTRYLFLINVALPAMREMGVDDSTIQAMTIHNPRRFLSGQ